MWSFELAGEVRSSAQPSATVRVAVSATLTGAEDDAIVVRSATADLLEERIKRREGDEP